MIEKKHYINAMKARLKRLPEEIEKAENAEFTKELNIILEPRRKSMSKQKIKKEIFSLPLKTRYRKLLRVLWNGKPKRIRELKEIIEREDIKSFVYRLNKTIVPKARVKNCRDLKMPGHYRLIVGSIKIR